VLSKHKHQIPNERAHGSVLKINDVKKNQRDEEIIKEIVNIT